MPLSSAGFDDIGGAVSSIFGAVGQLQSAKGYKKAADFALQNADIARQSADIKKLMAERQVYQTIGGQKSDVAGAGLAASGSALDILRSSEQQGALTKQLVSNQGAIDVLGYQAEASSYSSMAAAAKSSAAGGFLGGALKLAGAAVAFSDDLMKTGIVRVDVRRDGLGIYEFSYKGDTTGQRFRGVLASEVEHLYPAAVSRVDGQRLVNYSLIGVVPEVVNGR
jgi:hypothetical protein